eukprot:scaffold544_cov88-Cylindrotheca_fusiformis.AAC.1
MAGDSKVSSNKLGFLHRMSFEQDAPRWQKWFPCLAKEDSTERLNSTILSQASGSSQTRTLFATILPWCDETTRRQEEFKEEMRLLSRLRHPCKYRKSALIGECANR